MSLIKMRHVKKQYKNGVTAIYDLDLDIHKGEFVFVIGPTGCGKSTLIKMLYREERPTSGSIDVGGIDVAALKNRKVYVLRRRIGVVFQDFKLLQKSTVFENVAFALEVYGLPKDEIYTKVIKVLDLVGLKHKAKNYPTELSGGEQQRVAIARALCNNPEIILADEPTASLDKENTIKILSILKKLSNQDKCVIVICHDDIIKDYADEIIYLKNGRMEIIDEINWYVKNGD